MANKVRGIFGGTPSAAPINATNSGRADAFIQNYQPSFKENFTFPKGVTLDQRESKQDAIPIEQRENRQVLIKLFRAILDENININPTKMVQYNDGIVEASFMPNKKIWLEHNINLPLKGVGDRSLLVKSYLSSGKNIDFIMRYVDEVLSVSNDEDIIRILIAGSHEFGHYLSFKMGNHDDQVKRGIYLFSTRQFGVGELEHYVWLVFREECIAWNFAKRFLGNFKFKQWKSYEAVKANSLQTYLNAIKINQASFRTILHLSWLGDDFFDNLPKQHSLIK